MKQEASRHTVRERLYFATLLRQQKYIGLIRPHQAGDA